MGLRSTDYRYSPKLSVFTPLVVLTAIFAGLIALILLRTGASARATLPILLFGALVYGGAAALLVRYGLSNIGKLERLGLTDSLSLLPNRRALHLDAQRKAGVGEEIALALIDLDGFKVVNDHYGHMVGDRLIKDCSRLLVEICGGDATVYRLGGDEFAVLVTGPIAGNILEGICRKLLTRFVLPFHIDDRSVVVGASIGLARSSGKDGITSSELLRRTDVAMYASKRAGKMRCTWFSEEFDRNSELIREIDDALRQALVRDEFRLEYQPLVDTLTEKVIAAEALLRWDRPDGPNIGPSVFVPIAEESGLINPIGLWVLRQACADAKGWGEIKLSVNVSAAQLRNPEFPFELGQVLEETGFEPDRLELEVTETHLVVDSVVASRSLELLRQFGVRIVLDDFGTGYASIVSLLKLKPRRLKIDRQLVTPILESPAQRQLVGSIIEIGKSLGIEVLAEGVETMEHARVLKSLGCNALQGHAFAPAMSAAAFRTFARPRKMRAAS